MSKQAKAEHALEAKLNTFMLQQIELNKRFITNLAVLNNYVKKQIEADKKAESTIIIPEL